MLHVILSVSLIPVFPFPTHVAPVTLTSVVSQIPPRTVFLSRKCLCGLGLGLDLL